METYQTIWFVLIAILYTGYFLLEGFDFGVGILLPFIGKNDLKRRMIINSIGPHWDGNEVWLITAGGATFAAFPDWYATLFSGFYLPLFLMLILLILRGVAFEFRSKEDSPIWRSSWDWLIFGGSVIPAFLWGVVFTNFLRGVPIDATMEYTGGFFNLLSPFALVGGVVFLLVFISQGAAFLAIKTEKEVSESASKVLNDFWLPALAGTALFLGSLFWRSVDGGTLGMIPVIAGIVSLGSFGCVGYFSSRHKYGSSLTANSIGIIFLSASIFTKLFPRVMVSSIDPNYSLTIYNASSGLMTLQTMTIVASILVPIVLGYQIWAFWVLRRKTSADMKSLHY